MSATHPGADYFVPLARFILGYHGSTDRQCRKAMAILEQYSAPLTRPITATQSQGDAS